MNGQASPTEQERIAALEAENAKLIAENAKLVAKNPPPSFKGRKREFRRDQQDGI